MAYQLYDSIESSNSLIQTYVGGIISSDASGFYSASSTFTWTRPKDAKFVYIHAQGGGSGGGGGGGYPLGVTSFGGGGGGNGGISTFFGLAKILPEILYITVGNGGKGGSGGSSSGTNQGSAGVRGTPTIISLTIDGSPSSSFAVDSVNRFSYGMAGNPGGGGTSSAGNAGNTGTSFPPSANGSLMTLGNIVSEGNGFTPNNGRATGTNYVFFGTQLPGAGGGGGTNGVVATSGDIYFGWTNLSIPQPIYKFASSGEDAQLAGNLAYHNFNSNNMEFDFGAFRHQYPPLGGGGQVNGNGGRGGNGGLGIGGGGGGGACGNNIFGGDGGDGGPGFVIIITIM